MQLPTIPDVARELIATMKDDDIPFEKVRAAISKDPALTAKLIRLANSARFGLPRQVASLDDAITMVGLNQVRTLALASCMSGVFKDVPGVDADAFWKESMAIAGYSQWLARTLGSNVQESWLAGFLVRLGELIIAQKAPEQIPAIEQLPHHAGGRWERERTLLGFTEAQVTAELARRWRGAGASPTPSPARWRRPKTPWPPPRSAAWAASCMWPPCWPRSGWKSPCPPPTPLPACPPKSRRRCSSTPTGWRSTCRP